MSLEGLTDPGLGRGENPRNAWSRLLAAFDIAEGGGPAERWHLARKIAGSVEHAPDLTPEAFAIVLAHLEALRPADLPPAPVNGPADFLGHATPLPQRPFRRLDPKAEPPHPFPFGLALPPLQGVQNDCTFLHAAATALAPRMPVPRIALFVDAASAGDPGRIAGLLDDIAAERQGAPDDGPVTVTLFGPAGTVPDGPPPGAPIRVEHVPHDILDPAAQGPILHRAAEADIVVFLSGAVRLGPGALARIAWSGRVSQRLVQPLIPPPGAEAGRLVTPYALSALRDRISARYPFRDLFGLNLAVPAPLLRQTGALDPRFAGRLGAARELAFRLWNAGAWFAPVALAALDGIETRLEGADAQLFTALAPNHWDRKDDGDRFEVPKVSVYIPAYNASKYIERAVDSVLGQEFRDLEVCIANDGSADRTLEVLERRYGEEPRVRWLANPNGGIGFASNSAIGMARGIYIGQLDSDDCLKPGAVRRLATWLDENPLAACVYSSCERIDAAGTYIKDEYSYPVFSREKMILTSIAHHFRMFRRAAWARTGGFREDILNAVDYDIFLKLSETGAFHHIEEMYYQRRWHGENTSNVNVHHQTANTYKVQTEALRRQGLDRFWQVAVLEGQDDPRRVTYRRRPDMPMAVFWPDYSRSNPYQKLLYGTARDRAEIVAGNIDAALRLQGELARHGGAKGPLTFHLHWLNFVFLDLGTEAEARAAVNAFLERLTVFKLRGGRIVWTIHNIVSHDSPFEAVEAELSHRIVGLADVLHVHSAASIPEIEAAFPLDAAKIRVSPHGAYVGAYPDFVSRAEARAHLGFAAEDDIVLFSGQIRPYKGVDQLVTAFRSLLSERPRARLVLAGDVPKETPGALEELLAPLSAAERARIVAGGRFLDDMEMQVVFRAADVAVYPYTRILTSGSLLLALSFGVPVVVPDVGQTREVLGSGPGPAGRLYDGGAAEIGAALRELLAEKDKGRLPALQSNARAIAEATTWPDFGAVLFEAGSHPVQTG